MSWWTDLATARRASAEQRWLVVEALACLAASRAALAILPFRWIVRLWRLRPGEQPGEVSGATGGAEGVGWALRASSSRAPWRSTCLTRSLAGIVMLERRGLPGTLYLGVGRHPAGSRSIGAHSWLRSGDAMVSGGAGHERFTIISSFHRARGRPRS